MTAPVTSREDGPYRLEHGWEIVRPGGDSIALCGEEGADTAMVVDELNAAHAAARAACAEELEALGLTGCTGPTCTCLPGDIAERCEAVRALAAKWRTP